MKLPLLLLIPVLASAQDTPLTTFPYTPSLDPAAMDRAVNPCVDFYKFACGSWIKNNPMPPDQPSWDVYAKLGDENQRFLWGILRQAAKPALSHSSVERQIGDYFAACMDEAAAEKLGAKPLDPWLREIAALRSVKDLPALLAREHLATQGGSLLFGFGSNQDFADSTSVIGFADAGGLGLPDRDYYVKSDAKSEEIRRKYLDHVRKMFALLGDSPQAAEANAHTVMDIETALAKASLTRVDRRDPYKLYHKLTRAQVQELTPSFNWTAYLTASGVPRLQTLNVTEPEFFKAVEAGLKTVSLANWKTYLRWHVTNLAASSLSKSFVDESFDFYGRTLRGVPQNQPRWKRCVRSVDHNLGEALGQVFVAKTFGPDVKKRTLDMTKQIEAAMESEIKTLSWMSPATRQKALEKLHGMVNKIGYPDRWRDYRTVRIERTDYLGNVIRATEFESRRDLAKIGKPVDRGEWGMTPPTVNAYYNPQLNDINFPAGVLQPPLFDFKLDDAPNYGNTGATIGHELTHGFDDEGRQFDAQGNLKDWWTSEDAKAFEERAKCVSDQYSQYTIVDDIKINGKLTLGEDVADLGGTLLAYIAWKNATRDQKLQPVGGFTPGQRFWIGMAQWACGDERPENKRLNAAVNPHSPGEFRINGVVSNLPQFAEAFACKPGQPMVRPKACRIW